MLKQKIGIIGAGKIGAAIGRGVIQAGLVKSDQVIASDVSDSLREAIAQQLGIKVTSANHVVCEFADVIIVAVKPQILDSVVKEILHTLGDSKLLVSVAAGVPISRIEANLLPGA